MVVFALVWRQEFWGGEESIWDRRISPQQKHKDFYDSRCAKGDFIGEVEIIMRGFIRCFLIGPFISILLFACLGLSPQAFAAGNEDKRDVWQARLRLIEQGNCDQAWKEIWKEARKGDAESLEGLWHVMLTEALVPPSYFPITKDTAPQYIAENLAVLTIYARKSEMMSRSLRDSGTGLAASADGFLEPGLLDKVQSADACFKGGRSLDVCYKLAVKLKLIPSFEQYVSLIDNAPRPAVCPRGERPSDLK